MITTKIILTAALFFSLTPGSADAELLAPVYPGSVQADHELNESNKSYERVFYTRDPIEKAVGFYEKNLGPMKTETEGRAYSHAVTSRQVLVEKFTYMTENRGVTVTTDKPAAEDKSDTGQSGLNRAMASPYFNHPFFERLQELVTAVPEKDWDDFFETCERFGHLTWASYLPSERKNRRGRVMNTAEALIAEYRDKLEGKMEDTHDMGIRMQEAAMQGRFDEVRRLSAIMKDQTGNTMVPGISDWNEYVKVLESIDKHAYITKIKINLKPVDR